MSQQSNYHNESVNQLIEKYHTSLQNVRSYWEKYDKELQEMAKLTIETAEQEGENENLTKQQKKTKAYKKVYDMTFNSHNDLINMIESTIGMKLDNYLHPQQISEAPVSPLQQQTPQESISITKTPTQTKLNRRRIEVARLTMPSSPPCLSHNVAAIITDESTSPNNTNKNPIPRKELPIFGKGDKEFSDIFELVHEYEFTVHRYSRNIEQEWPKSLTACFDFPTKQYITPLLEQCREWRDVRYPIRTTRKSKQQK